MPVCGTMSCRDPGITRGKTTARDITVTGAMSLNRPRNRGGCMWRRSFIRPTRRYWGSEGSASMSLRLAGCFRSRGDRAGSSQPRRASTPRAGPVHPCGWLPRCRVMLPMADREERHVSALAQPIEELLNAALVGELTVIDDKGRPVTHPLIPLYDGERIYLTSSVLFSRKLEHIKANPKVSLSISDPSAVSVRRFRRATIQGDATVDDSDLHSGWERKVLPLWRVKEPAIDFFLGKRVALPLFFERGIIEIRPRRAFLWEDGDTSNPPQIFELVEARR